MNRFALASLAAAAALAACSGGGGTDGAPPPQTPAATPPSGDDGSPIVLGAEPQRTGDPAKGRAALLNQPYVPCGVPDSAFSKVFGDTPAEERIADRTRRNATLPYNWTSYTTKDGVALVTSNCLQCHAGFLQGKLVVGLGAADSDYTQEQGSTAQAVSLLVSDPKEKAELAKWQQRIETIAPYATLSARGPNPADEFTAVLFAHHDPKTLAWTDTPVIDVPPAIEVPVDVPPWWRMKKKTSMFYTGGGRGDHARIMMTASVLCTSSVEEAQAIDAYFPDVRAYITSLDAPKWPFAIDAALAQTGRALFERTCSRCHGTYGDAPTYPNEVIRIEEVGTDGLLAAGAAEFAPADRSVVPAVVLRPARAPRAAARVRRASARRRLGDGAVPPQRLGADDRRAPRLEQASDVLDALLRLERLRPASARLEVHGSVVEDGRDRLRHDEDRLLERRPHVRRRARRRRTRRAARIPEDAVATSSSS